MPKCYCQVIKRTGEIKLCTYHLAAVWKAKEHNRRLELNRKQKSQ